MAVIRSFIDGPLVSTEGTQRFFNYYPETDIGGTLFHWTPTVWFDGVDDQTGVPFADTFSVVVDSTRSLFQEKIQNRLALPSPLTIGLTVTYGARGDTGTVDVQIVAVDSITFAGLALRLALTESKFYTPQDSLHLKQYNQILRDYFPDEMGIPLTIAQGDTFSHTEAFVIDPAWADSNCRIVAFVQDDTTREVVQAVQDSVVGSAPAPGPPAAVADLSAAKSGDDLRLEWSAVTTDTSGHPAAVDQYHIYRGTAAFFGPGSDPFDSTAACFYLDESGVVGDTGVHYFYFVTAVANGKESGCSGTVGEFDQSLVNGK